MDSKSTPAEEVVALGSVWELGEGDHVITRPDGQEVTVTTGYYVLNQAGKYTTDDQEVTAK